MTFRGPILALVGALVLVGCGQNRPTEPKAPVAKPPEPDKTFRAPVRGVKLEFDDPATGRPLWRLSIKEADLALTDGKEAFGELRGISGTLYEQGKPALQVSAAKCRADADRKTIVLEGGINAKSSANGLELNAERMSWSAQSNEVVATGNPVIIRRGNEFEMRDTRLVADTRLTRVRTGR